MSGIGNLIPYLPIVFSIFNISLKFLSNILNPHLLAADISITVCSLYTGLLLKNVYSGSFNRFSGDSEVTYILIDIVLILFWIFCIIIGSKKHSLASGLMFILSFVFSYTALFYSTNLIN